MKIETTKEKILQAASKCKEAEATLKILFPEVFEEDKKVLLLNIRLKGNQLWLGDEAELMYFGNNAYPPPSERDCSILLSRAFKWEIKNYEGFNYLIPTRR